MEVRHKNKRRERQWKGGQLRGCEGISGKRWGSEAAVDEVLITVPSQHRCRDFTRHFTRSSEVPACLIGCHRARHPDRPPFFINTIYMIPLL
jgi:hypothetical protein